MTRPMSIELVNEYGTPAVCIRIEGRTAMLESTDVDAVIEHLAMLRASMRPEVPRKPAHSHQYLIEMDPCWHAETSPLFDGVVLMLRHTGIGWAGFAIPQENLEKLTEVLSSTAKAVKEAQSAERLAMLPN
ncbi:hypothetical protein M3I53_18780 [Paraburkholderia sp. CNPSo 3272]|uniref:hypothetical protein n=1 Tax=Paraburkholderia sp. CNPSo 3272 TaxID=2940931 RepID=UPI0020B76428|nr:hypothetical protein [Paraburkholderia sp. CNPSo 3272]MCP3725146.1 hypothetical protein [Paraburkholderia sp. CNPSo 3272]